MIEKKLKESLVWAETHRIVFYHIQRHFRKNVECFACTFLSTVPTPKSEVRVETHRIVFYLIQRHFCRNVECFACTFLSTILFIIFLKLRDIIISLNFFIFYKIHPTRVEEDLMIYFSKIDDGLV